MNTQVVVFHLEDLYFGINIKEVSEIQLPSPITPMIKSDKNVEGIIDVRGKIHGVINLRKKLGIESQPNQTEDEKRRFIILDEYPLALLVDKVDDIVATRDGNIHDAERIYFVDKNTIQYMLESNGRMVSVLNLENLFQQEIRVIPEEARAVSA